MLDPMKNATPGFIKFMRAALTCTKEYGDGNNDDDNGVPARDNRTYVGGTLIVEEKNTDRAFVTTGQALLKYLTPSATFGASWSLKSPASSAELRGHHFNHGPFLFHAREIDGSADTEGGGLQSGLPLLFHHAATRSRTEGQIFNHPFYPPRSGEARCGALSRALRYPTVTTRKLPRVSLWHP